MGSLRVQGSDNRGEGWRDLSLIGLLLQNDRLKTQLVQESRHGIFVAVIVAMNHHSPMDTWHVCVGVDRYLAPPCEERTGFLRSW